MTSCSILNNPASAGSPIYVTAPPGDTHRLFVVQRGGRVIVLRDGRRAGTFLHVDTTTGGERGLLSIAFAPDYAQSGLFYVDYTDRDGDDPRGRVPRRADREPGGPGSPRHVLSSAPREQPQRRAARSSAPTACSTSASATAASRATADRQRARTSAPAREDPAHRPARQRGQPLHGARRQPVRRALGREAGDLRLRPAQPVALLLRPLTGDLVIGDVGQDTIEEVDYDGQGRGQGRQLRLARVRGPLALRPRQRARRGAAGAAADPRLRLVLDRRRLRRARPAVPALRGRYVYGDLCRPHCTPRACARTRPRTGRSACACHSSSRSGRMPPAMFTPCR